MKVSAVTLARVLGLVETFDLSPKGAVFYPDLVAAMVERFRFQQYPTKFEEFDEQKGVNFVEGTWKGTTIDKFTIYQNALLIDTRSSTDDSERILGEALTWGADKFGLAYGPNTIKRKRYLSNLTFYSDIPVLNLNAAVSNLCERLSAAVFGIVDEQFKYQSIRFDIDFDRSDKQVPIAPFTIQRRINTPWSDNKYFSEAPLPTNVHTTLLEEFEAEMRKLVS